MRSIRKCRFRVWGVPMLPPLCAGNCRRRLVPLCAWRCWSLATSKNAWRCLVKGPFVQHHTAPDTGVPDTSQHSTTTQAQQIVFLFGIMCTLDSGQKNIPWCGAEDSFHFILFLALHYTYLCTFLAVNISFSSSLAVHILRRDWLSPVQLSYIETRKVASYIFDLVPPFPHHALHHHFALRSHGSAGKCRLTVCRQIPVHLVNITSPLVRGLYVQTSRLTGVRQRKLPTRSYEMSLGWGH